MWTLIHFSTKLHKTKKTYKNLCLHILPMSNLKKKKYKQDFLFTDLL